MRHLLIISGLILAMAVINVFKDLPTVGPNIQKIVSNR